VRQRVAIVGGGMGGLAAAWELSQGSWRDELDSITVYQRGSRLGGKGASTRGVHGRIEEHGLHVWLGYYHNAFRLLREVYRELDRPTTDPGCPIATFDDAFLPAPLVGVADLEGGRWSTWVGEFARNGLELGIDDVPAGPLTVADLVRRGIEMLTVLATSLDPTPRRDPPPGVWLSASPRRTRSAFDPVLGTERGLGTVLRRTELAAVAAGVQALSLLGRAAGAGTERASSLLVEQLRDLRASLSERALGVSRGRRLAQVMDLVGGCIQAAIEDGLLGSDGFERIDHLDFREWLAGRVEPATLDSPIIRGLYDLVFAYEGGDRSRPRFSAGLGLFLANRLFFEYRGSIFWKMRAGMGEVVFAPLYQALRARGVEFAFFHCLHDVELSAGGRSVAALRLGRQADVCGGPRSYDPLSPVRGLPCFPAVPARDQFDVAPPPGVDEHRVDRGCEHQVELRAGRDFDTVVLAVSVGILPHVARQLVESKPAWRAMVGAVGTVATRSVQLWLRPDERALGAHHPGATISGYAPPLDTFASMSHLAPVEAWPAGSQPGTIGYFCGALADDVAADPAGADATVRADLEHLLAGGLAPFWPAAVTPEGGLRLDLLCSTDALGTAPAVYARANCDPSDRYVQSLPGSGAFRLRADQSGCDNLVLAGDWINSGMNAGCVEAAVMSGLQAANVVLGRPLTEGLLGSWYGLEWDGLAPPESASA
jgi:uncharacterized protein with NAD-binding domain and iron-sulfur cluster